MHRPPRHHITSV